MYILQVRSVASLMRDGGIIDNISRITGCTIDVPRERPAGKSMIVTITADSASGLGQAMQMISECFA